MINCTYKASFTSNPFRITGITALGLAALESVIVKTILAAAATLSLAGRGTRVSSDEK
jgi:hypothetical protein